MRRGVKMRLIDACALQEEYKARHSGKRLLLIDVAPTVDAVPVRRGKWIHRPEIGWGSTWICSMCDEKTVETVMGEPRYRFCPMCGADMRVVDDE